MNSRDINDSTPLHFAGFYGHMPVVRFPVENAHADVNARCDNQAFPTTLTWARHAGHVNVMDYLALQGGLET